MTKKPQLLAPAGSLECLKAAVFAGADAVYFGAPKFNARMRAKNFSDLELDEAFRICKLYGVKTNITLNTLLYGREFSSALDVVKSLEEKYSPDAYIVQDLGLAYELKQRFPGIVLHASTQAEVHNAYGLVPFKNLGFSRVVIARESSMDEIKCFQNSGIETEIFIHGAMCVCQSGGCLMSSFIGSRSGNRGECAYPCRLAYKGKNGYPLSLKDMCLADHITEILSFGVDALKIEGRMKPASYVYEVTSLYRKLIDQNRNATTHETQHQKAVFSRSGFTDGYFTNKISPEMFGIRSDADKQQTKSVVTEITEKKLPITIKASFNVGQKASASFSHGGICVISEGETVTHAQTQPITDGEIKARLSKLGSTPFEAKSIDVSVSKDAYMPVSLVNALRRDGAEKLENKIIESRKREEAPKCTLQSADFPKNEKGLIIRMGLCPNMLHLEKCSRYELPIEKDGVWKLLAKNYAKKLCLVIPRTVFDSEMNIVKKLLQDAKDLGITKVCLENPQHLPLCDSFTKYGGICLNITNKHTAKVMASLGFDGVAVSPEANMALAGEIGCAYAVYGKLPVMHTRSCIISNINGCMNKKSPADCRAQLVDRTGAVFETVGSFCHTNTIYNSVPLWLLDKPITTPSPILYFTTETQDEENRILDCYFKKSKPFSPFTRGKA